MQQCSSMAMEFHKGRHQWNNIILYWHVRPFCGKPQDWKCSRTFSRSARRNDVGEDDVTNAALRGLLELVLDKCAARSEKATVGNALVVNFSQNEGSRELCKVQKGHDDAQAD